jgi:hypothetical protein
MSVIGPNASLQAIILKAMNTYYVGKSKNIFPDIIRQPSKI